MNENLNQMLQEKGIRLSSQRIAIFSYVAKNKNHPTVDDIYCALLPTNPSLSRTTVYNTLKLFSKKGLISIVRIEDDELRYDADTKEHAHFKCISCKRIFDIKEANVHLFAQECKNALPSRFCVQEVRVGVWGKCADCAEKEN